MPITSNSKLLPIFVKTQITSYMKKGIVYRLVNRVNGKSYIGRTMDLSKRMYEHKAVVRKATGKILERPIVKAFLEFGMDAFDLEILYESEPFEAKDKKQIDALLDEKEIFYIEKFNTVEDGYNLTKGGKGAYGLGDRIRKGWSKEKRKKLSERMSGVNNPNFGKKFVGIKRPALVGKKLSEERKRKISEALKGKGHPQSEETRRKISEHLKGIPKSESHRKSVAEAKKGKKRPDMWKPILQYSTDGVFIKEWQSIREARTIYNSKQIGMCAKGKFRTIAGFVWRFKTSDDIPQKIEVPKTRNSDGLFL